MDAVAHALSDPVRREILLMLRLRCESAGSIAEAFTVSRPAVSRHLRVLREAGLVSDEVRGRERIYRLQLEGLEGLEAFLHQLRQPARWSRRFDALETEVHRVKRSNQLSKSSEPKIGKRNSNRKESA